MSFEAYKKNLVSETERSVELFSRRKDFEREEWVVRALLRSLGVRCCGSDLRSGDEPVDVLFAQASEPVEARFQVKELIQPADRRRSFHSGILST